MELAPSLFYMICSEKRLTKADLTCGFMRMVAKIVMTVKHLATVDATEFKSVVRKGGEVNSRITSAAAQECLSRA